MSNCLHVIACFCSAPAAGIQEAGAAREDRRCLLARCAVRCSRPWCWWRRAYSAWRRSCRCCWRWSCWRRASCAKAREENQTSQEAGLRRGSRLLTCGRGLRSLARDANSPLPRRLQDRRRSRNDVLGDRPLWRPRLHHVVPAVGVEAARQRGEVCGRHLPLQRHQKLRSQELMARPSIMTCPV